MFTRYRLYGDIIKEGIAYTSVRIVICGPKDILSSGTVTQQSLKQIMPQSQDVIFVYVYIVLHLSYHAYHVLHFFSIQKYDFFCLSYVTLPFLNANNNSRHAGCVRGSRFSYIQRKPQRTSRHRHRPRQCHRQSPRPRHKGIGLRRGHAATSACREGCERATTCESPLQ